jgi:hypothetical protein
MAELLKTNFTAVDRENSAELRFLGDSWVA